MASGNKVRKRNTEEQPCDSDSSESSADNNDEAYNGNEVSILY